MAFLDEAAVYAGCRQPRAESLRVHAMCRSRSRGCHMIRQYVRMAATSDAGLDNDVAVAGVGEADLDMLWQNENQRRSRGLFRQGRAAGASGRMWS